MAASRPDWPERPGYYTSTDSSITLNLFASRNDGGSKILTHSLYMQELNQTGPFTLVHTFDETFID